MGKSNEDRLIHLAEDVFDVRHDPDQLNVDQKVLRRMEKMHPSTISEEVDENGPVAWLLLIPTTWDLMNQFLEGAISEKELFRLTPLNAGYEALYLCSALVLEEYRRKGITRRLALTAIENIRKDHPLKALFVWPFTEDGNRVAEKIAELVGMPLYRREQKSEKLKDNI